MFISTDLISGIQIGGVCLLSANTIALGKFIFSAGALVQRVEDHDRRIEQLEAKEPKRMVKHVAGR